MIGPKFEDRPEDGLANDRRPQESQERPDSICVLERDADQRVHATEQEFSRRLLSAGLDKQGNSYRMLMHRWKIRANEHKALQEK